MRSRALFFSFVVACLSAATIRVAAITYGFVDSSNAFSNAGAFLVRSPTNGAIYPICSGTLISPTVFLTASHCTYYFQQELMPLGFTAWVSFDASIPFANLTSNTTNLVGVANAVTNQYFNRAQSDPGDIAVLVLNSAVNNITPAVLPTANLLDRLVEARALAGVPFTNVGYGVQNRVVGGGVPYFVDANPVPRMYSFSTFNALNKGFLRLSQNPATGDSGTCFGDSGGPQFLDVGGIRTIVSITITGDSVCRATNVAYRLDTLAARNFLSGWVALP
jgi:hypothetical protein